MVRIEKRNPSWWQLYLLGLGMVGLLVLGARAPLSERGHQAAAIGVLVLVYGLVELWLRANTVALMRVGRLVQVPQPRPDVVRRTQDEEIQPVLVSWRQPQEAVVRPQAEGSPSLQERSG